ncbi:MAG: type I-C CRISPR-associated protein Cas5 [Candidatus Methylumidiphilus alinenensis]|uniref:pre-crRNA processing endonuclease n=1 Tax=Candidatus Methylumidiphilus alinenensis TaxID=2202197 RepID=A0A2W4RLP1_9GAMM|nr:MAG: type I-C CRISPR-associated protein Cas5 [Candidatus Methylumidiphilus alinenensis]
MRSFCLKVFGDYACFTRPEMKVERVSYDVPTPSAARAIFEAILWKPVIRWQVTKIEVLKPIRWISVRRNEVGAVASLRTAQTEMQSGRGELGLFIEKERQQRAGLFLRDVAYRLHARFEMTGQTGSGDSPEKFRAMFERRAAIGQCFNQPYFGCREFAAHFELVTQLEAEALQQPAIAETRDLGWMLHDIDFANDMQPRFFRAELRQGVIDVPAWDTVGIRS